MADWISEENARSLLIACRLECRRHWSSALILCDYCNFELVDKGKRIHKPQVSKALMVKSKG
jgi:hypothetical protein